MLTCGSVVAPQNSVTLPSRTWLTLAAGTRTNLVPREADSVHSATACSSLASTSWTSSRNVPAVSSASLPKKASWSWPGPETDDYPGRPAGPVSVDRLWRVDGVGCPP